MLHCVVFKDEIITENVLNKAICNLAGQLELQKATPGDIILCKADTHLGTIIQWISCLKLGIAPLFVPSDFSIDNVEYFFKIINVKLILVTSGMDTHNITKVHSDYDSIVLNNAPSGSVIHMTSATTGNPKLVLRTGKQLGTEISRYTKRLKLSEDDTFMPIVPLYHSFGFISGMMAAFEIGAKIVIPDIILPRNVIKSCNANKVSFLLGVPYFFNKMVSVSERYSLSNSIRYVISSGGPMKPGLQEAFFKRFGLFLLQQYGSTETGSLSISEPGDDFNCVGIPMEGVKLVTKEEEDKQWLYVSSPHTIGSYITEKGIIELNDILYKTGDMGYIDDKGKVIVQGRGDDVIIIAGKKVPKALVTEVIQKISGVKAAKIFQNNSNALQELICEYVSDNEIDPEVFINHCKTCLPEFQIPKYYIKANSLSKSWKE